MLCRVCAKFKDKGKNDKPHHQPDEYVYDDDINRASDEICALRQACRVSDNRPNAQRQAKKRKPKCGKYGVKAKCAEIWHKQKAHSVKKAVHKRRIA